VNSVDKYKRVLFKGFNINVSAKDRNGNIGFKEDELPSIKDMVVDIFIGALLAIVSVIAAVFNFLYNLIISIMETTFYAAIDVFISIVSVLFDPVVDIVLDIGNIISGLLLKDSENIKNDDDDDEGEENTGWEFSFEELGTVLLKLLNFIIIAGSIIIGIKIAYMIIKVLFNIISGGSGEGLFQVTDAVLATCCPKLLLSIIGALGFSLVVNGIFHIIDGKSDDSLITKIFDSIGIGSSIINDLISIGFQLAKGFAAIATAWQTQTFKALRISGEAILCLLLSILSFCTISIITIKTVRNEATEFGIFVGNSVLCFLAMISLALMYHMGKNPLKVVWSKASSPFYTISDLLTVGFALGTIGIYFDFVTDTTLDLNILD